MDTWCTTGLGTSKIWSLCCYTKRGSTQYRFFTSGRGRNVLFLWNLNMESHPAGSKNSPMSAYPQNAEIFVSTMETKGFFHFEIIINVLESSFRFIWIPMFWVHVTAIIINLLFLMAGIDVRSQNLTSINTVPALKGLNTIKPTQCRIDYWPTSQTVTQH